MRLLLLLTITIVIYTKHQITLPTLCVQND